MTRKPRNYIKDAYHHIYLRGNNRKTIFHDEGDYNEPFKIWSRIHNKTPISISAYCIMPNHYHFLLKSEGESLSKVMAVFNKRYTDYYNKKYEHCGHVFQQRFNSSPLPYPDDLLAVSRYIHRNPISTTIPMVERMEDYRYSSYQFYKNGTPSPYSFINLHDLQTSMNTISIPYGGTYCDFVEAEKEIALETGEIKWF